MSRKKVLPKQGGLSKGDGWAEGWWSECLACGGRVEAMRPAQSGPCEACGKEWRLVDLVNAGKRHGVFIQGRIQ
jgi:hypothetical protein